MFILFASGLFKKQNSEKVKNATTAMKFLCVPGGLVDSPNDDILYEMHRYTTRCRPSGH